MKNIGKQFALAAIAACVWSCAEQIEMQAPRDYVEKEFSASLDEVATRTALNGEKQLIWKAGDVINYYSSEEDSPKSCAIAADKLSEDGRCATLRLSVVGGDKFIVAAYGGSSITDHKENSFTLNGAVPAEQDGTFEHAHVSVAKVDNINAEKISFKNVTSLVKFTLDRSDVEYVLFTATDGTKIHGAGKLAVSFDGASLPSAAFTAAGGGSTIKVNVGQKSGTFYISTLPCTLANGFTIKFKNAVGKSLGMVETDKAAEIQANGIMDLGTLDSRFVLDKTDYFDLSATGLANCYIVDSEGLYKFNATLKGNSVEGVGAAAKAKVLWESFGTSVKPEVGSVVKDVEYADGQIKFQSVAEGNAVIAVTDASDNILWSWHIWASYGFNPEASGQKYGSAVMMDRNLGALSASPGNPLANGLNYQWGRKDPFIGSSTNYSDVLAATSETFPEGQLSDNSHGTIEYATANPMVYIRANSELNSSQDWLVTSTQLYPENTRWQSEKTMYDPCPSGWRVADGGPTGVWASIGLSYSFDNTNKGLRLGSTVPEAWYPATGALTYYGNIQAVGAQGGIWSCTSYSYVSYTIFFSISYYLTDSYKVRTMGMPVRCQKTTGPASVEVTSVEINKTSAQVVAGKTLALTANVLPANATTKTLVWTSSDETVATVSATGVVTGVAAGTATVTASSNNGKSASCEVTVITPAYHDEFDLSALGTANCYLITKAGKYSFDPTMQGKSDIPIVGNADSAEVLWESFGTVAQPEPGSVITDVKLVDDLVCFNATGTNGNASIVLKNPQGTIIWSWHIWVCCDYDIEKTALTYANDAGIVMDRNIGATSATPGDVTSYGLLYQWGRKDPFLSPATKPIEDKTQDIYPAASTITWPNPEKVNAVTGNVEYSITKPTTFFGGCDYNFDWIYRTSASSDHTRWNENIKQYDPCPLGWTIPEGALWKNAGIPDSSIIYDSELGGLVINAAYCGGVADWYPAGGFKDDVTGILKQNGTMSYWSRSASGNMYSASINFYFTPEATGTSSGANRHARAYPVRCVKE